MITTTMKKEYIAPETLAFEMHICSTLLAGSLGGDPDPIEEVTPSPEPPVNNEFNGREFGFEEEEFYEEF